MKQVIDIYIPRMLGTVTEKEVIDSFYFMNIGKVTYIDMYKKMNEMDMHIILLLSLLELYESNMAKLLQERLNNRNIMHLVYDEENNQYWEIKKHIPKEQRTKSCTISNNNTILPFYNEVEKELLINEYEELEKIICACLLNYFGSILYICIFYCEFYVLFFFHQTYFLHSS